MKKVRTILLVATAVTAMAGDDAGTTPQAVPVCLNPAGNQVIVYRAEAIASDIFAGIGIKLRWKTHARYCAREEGGIVITFEDVTTDRNPGELAHALPFEGSHIVVRLNRVREAISPAGVPVLLAHVMTHEIAHVLQCSDYHSAEGIMKRKWEPHDFVEMKWRPMRFTA